MERLAGVRGDLFVDQLFLGRRGGDKGILGCVRSISECGYRSAIDQTERERD
jgi:hypothetical protein